ncbi:hypothetical protein FB45DRAFT_892888 [Roridomyces roridus]|uniref:Succinate dehydrogenase assembly factor 4, mitochondrial n=1 Tax=Roridomyces roridus TaxID=1738132 RepID=A0AAD7FZ70_9AGAR|nr:hypothetical protein FB45DRAFT_892888 [Roridomyces roridus]
MLSSRRIALRVFSRPCARTYNNDSYPRARPAPIPLPREDQREFEDLQRAAQQGTSDQHPDAREELKPDFEPGFQGNSVNPTTGEINGPKREPVGATGDWSFKGRVSDF